MADVGVNAAAVRAEEREIKKEMQSILVSGLKMVESFTKTATKDDFARWKEGIKNIVNFNALEPWLIDLSLADDNDALDADNWTFAQNQQNKVLYHLIATTVRVQNNSVLRGLVAAELISVHVVEAPTGRFTTSLSDKVRLAK